MLVDDAPVLSLVALMTLIKKKARGLDRCTQTRCLQDSSSSKTLSQKEREREREREREKENITSYLCMLDKYMMTINRSIVTFQFLVGIRSRVVPSAVFVSLRV